MRALFYFIFVCVSCTLNGQLQWIDPDDNLPSNIALRLSQLECQSDYNFPSCMWSADPADANAQTWPFPLIEGVHYEDPNGTAVFTSTHTPCSIITSNGTIKVTYTLDDGINVLSHEFTIEINCYSCADGNGIFCANCEIAKLGGCSTCNASDLLQGFSSCNPPYEGMIQGPPQPLSLCNGQGVPNNMSWFAFVAGSDDISVSICPSECIPSEGTIGIQAGIYDDCGGECIAGDGGCPNTLRCIDFSLADMIVGKTYYLFVDGCNGAECQYDITISAKDYSYDIDNVVEVVAETDCTPLIEGTYCSGQTIRFNVNHDGSTGNFGPPGGPYIQDENYCSEFPDLCYEWSFSPELEGVSNVTYNPQEDGFVTPDFTLPLVTTEAIITVCIEDVFGPCENPCAYAECISGDCCLDIIVSPIPNEVCVIDVLIEDLESPSGYDPTEAFNVQCGGGVAGWLGSTNITLQDVESMDTLVYSVVDPDCNCAYEQKLVINPVRISKLAECQGQNPGENTEFIEWYSNLSNLIVNDSISSCGGNLSIVDNYNENNWFRNGSCSFEVNIDFILTDDCGSSPQRIPARCIITDSNPPLTDFENQEIRINCLSELGSTPPPLNVNDDCDGPIIINPIKDDSGFICENEGVIIYSYIVEDECGNVATNSPVTIIVNIEPETSNELQWINPSENLPSDLTVVLNQEECELDYDFPNCLWSVEPSDVSAKTYPFPLLEGVHFIDPCGNAVFTSTETPCSILPDNNGVIVTYRLDNGCGTSLEHSFTVEFDCAYCDESDVIFCSICDESESKGCFACNVNDLLHGFSSCTPPYQGAVQSNQPNPLCNGQGVPNNMSWFAFMPGSPTISIEVCPTECIPSENTIGIQAGIFDECDGECLTGAGLCPNTLECISLSLNDMVIGNSYYIYVDGCNGSECTYNISIEGQDAYIIDDIVEVIVNSDCQAMNPQRYCSGQTISFNVNHNGATGNFGPAGGPYDPGADLCYEWSFFPELDGITSGTYNQINDGFVTPDFTLPFVTSETIITVCIEDVFGPCDNPCAYAECISEDCCLDIVVVPAPVEICVIDVLIEDLESSTGYDPTEAFNIQCGGGVAGWLGSTNITLQDVQSVDTLVYSVVDPDCNCELVQKLVINPVLNTESGECQGQNPGENSDFLAWYLLRTTLILENADSPCGGSLTISDNYNDANWTNLGNCTFEVNIEWIVTDDCGSSPQSTLGMFTISDTTPPTAAVTSSITNATCFSSLSGAPPSIDIQDSCEGIITIAPLVDDSGLICESEGIIIYTYNIEDACGNVSSDSPVTVTINIGPDSNQTLQWIDPDNDLPGDISLTLNQIECTEDYIFPGCVWVEDPTDPNSTTWPYPLIEGVHYLDPCGTAVFTSTKTPCPINPGTGDILVTYKLEDECGTTLEHTFEISFNCSTCDGGNGIFCSICDGAQLKGCFTCNVNDLLQGFASCNPPYDGMIQGPPQPESLCNGQGVPNNMSWFAFVAGSNGMSVSICPSECIPSGGTIGIQAGIYDDCGGECIAGDGGCPSTLRCIDFSLNDFVIGKTYYLFVDGCNGAECQYDITISGQDGYRLDDMVEVVAETDCESPVPNKYCPGQTIRFNVNHDGATGNFGPAGGPYDEESDLCFEWSFTPELDGVSNEIYNQLEDGFVTPNFTLPDVISETIISVCIEDVFGPCEDSCDDADCITGDCCLDIVVAPLPDEICVIDVLISELESSAGYDPTAAFEEECGGGIAGWLGATDITLQDVESADTLVYSVLDPECNCAFDQKLVINPVLVSSVTDNKKSSIEIYPNPANNVIRIKGLQLNDHNYSLIDIHGRVLQSGIVSDQITVQEIEEGIYILELSTLDNSEKYQAKVVVVK